MYVAYSVEKNKISDRGKHRLRIAARFLRQEGHQFNQGNFYQAVIGAIQTIGEENRRQLQELVNWLEEYELEEIKQYGKARSLPRPQNKPMTGKKKA